MGCGAGLVRPRGAALGGVGVMPRLMRGDGEKVSGNGVDCQISFLASSEMSETRRPVGSTFGRTSSSLNP